MKRAIGRLAVLLGVALASAGCVERKFVIEAYPIDDPHTNIPAQVLRNGQPIGFTPVDDAFVYYGKYDFTLIKDGYETMHLVEKIRAPWYEYPPLDFFVENLWPFTIHDVRRLRLPMQPARITPPDQVLPRATELRGQGKLIGDPAPPRPPAPPPTGGVPVGGVIGRPPDDGQ